MLLANDFLSDSHDRLTNNISLNQNDQPTIGKYLVEVLLKTLDPLLKKIILEYENSLEN